MASEGTLCSGTGARPRPGWLRGCLLFPQGRFFSRDMPRSSPGPSNPFRRSATLCRLTGPPHSLCPWSPGDRASEDPQHTRPPAWSWLRSLRSPVASVPAVSFEAPSSPCVWKHGHPDYLSDTQTLWMGAAPALTPMQGQGAALRHPQSRCCQSSPSRGPRCGPPEAWLPGQEPAGLALAVDIPLLL